ncbi:hypothetical protein OOZ63_10705 [Paucibacter sp. PLA-PC-4]|uniref:hypothetical protein n=1 Tax=Paucibacter sp. PLA-PC-4 TaxID=2993655 RepID=UPI0022491BC3|nr:hypothetical protein [Paucibacter sp. PLA-PC-4]MCX2862309.1 hypothetical protein [Paucibacter sp. PLA-PC-4]
MKSKLYIPSLLLSLMLLQAPGAQAQSTASQASALSMLPVAVSVAAPVMLLSAGVALTVVAVEATAQGSVWVLERASDGARASVRFAGQASAVLGTAVVITVIGSGYVLSAAGEAIAFVPNAIGTALLHNEQLTR